MAEKTNSKTEEATLNIFFTIIYHLLRAVYINTSAKSSYKNIDLT